jgi:hypothetical protein
LSKKYFINILQNIFFTARGNLCYPGSFFSGIPYFLLIFSTGVKFFYTAHRLCVKRKLFLANEFNPGFPDWYIGFSGCIGFICPPAQKKACGKKACKAVGQNHC